jgi:farnesyl-diphosphate farnesyltransferase
MTDLDDLLQKTSRTFALTIPYLPPPTRDEVGLAYLLFRIVDTFEDATRWAPDRRVARMREFLPLLETPDPPLVHRFAERCAADPPVDHAGYLELLREIPFVLSRLHVLPEPSRQILVAHVRRSTEGMIEVVAKAGPDRVIRIGTIPELRDYCYIVAGIVGEMLTELFLLDRPRLARAADYLRARSRPFGEGLQLVNILKDADVDAREGRVYIPAERYADVVALAREDLQAATEYTLALQQLGSEVGLVTFNALLVRLATGTLAAIRDKRPGNKLTRHQVLTVISEVLSQVDRGDPALPAATADAQLPAAE